MKKLKNSGAHYVIQKFGGRASTARLLDVDPITVWRWTIPKERGGTDGYIPTKTIVRAMRVAKKLNIDLTLEHLVYGDNA